MILYRFLHEVLYIVSYRFLREATRELGWFKKDFLEFLFLKGEKGRFKLHIWSLILFEKWFGKIYRGGSYDLV